MSDTGIESLTINPGAETPTASPVSITGNQEKNFFNQGALEYKHKEAQLNVGLLGKLFGNGTAASANIAGLVVLVLLIFIGVSLTMPSAEGGPFRDKITSVITLVLGYLFGIRKDKKDE